MKKSILLLSALLVPVCLYAVDGQVLINQSTVTAAGGFPYIISQPGSYKLSGSLVVPGNTNAIQIRVSNVTLDLNGFSITTPTSPQVPASFGIQSIAGVSAVSVRNGFVRGFTIPLFFATPATFVVLEDLTVEWGLVGGASGFGVGPYSRVVRVNATDQSLTYSCPSVIALNSLRSASRDFSVPGVGTCSATNNATSF